MTQGTTVSTPVREDEEVRRHGSSPSPPPPDPGSGQGWGDASAAGVVRAILSRWVLVLLTVIVFAGAAVYVGVTRKPTYTATASVNVGQVDVRVQALSGFVVGATSLASSYSRIATSETIIDPVAERLGTSRAEVARRLSATAVPESPIFEIIGTGRTSDDAERLANAATREMQSYVARRSSGDNAAEKLLKAYSAQVGRASDLERRYNRLRNLREQGGGSATVSEERQDVPTAKQVRRALIAHQTADLQRQALGTQYQQRSAETESTAGIELLKRALRAESDRETVLQQLVLIAILAGLVVGCALALLFGRRAARRTRFEAQQA